METILTMEELAAKIVAIRDEAEALVKQYNEAFQSGDFDKANSVLNMLDVKIKEHNSKSVTYTFRECGMSEEGALMAAVKRMTYPIIKKKEERVEGSAAKVMTITDTNEIINLRALHDYFGRQTGVDHGWAASIELFWQDLNAEIGSSLGGNRKEIKDSITISKEAEARDLGKNPASKTQVLKTLNRISAEMLGEGYKFDSRHVSYLLNAFTSKDKRKYHTIKTEKAAGLYRIILEDLNAIVANKEFKLKYANKAK